MGLADELAWTTLTDLARRIRTRELGPVEVMDATLRRIDARNPSLNALVFLDADGALERAAAAERAVVEGGELGLLHGVPTALKDLFDFRPGWPATFGGIRALRDLRIDARCAYAERMEAAGAVLVGKTNAPVMGFRGVTDNPLFGPTGNPFDTSRNAGGSSGGGAAVVADGLLCVAEGTDGGGSIRIPASWSGVVGLKASFGRVPSISRPNAFGGTDPFLFEGPLTRTVADAALALTALNGEHPADPYSLPGHQSFTKAPERSIEGMRVAWSPELDVFPIDRRVAAVCADAVRAFEDAGARVEEVRLGLRHDQRELSDLWCRLIMPINVAAMDGFRAMGIDLWDEHPGDLPPEYRAWLERGAQLTARDVTRDQVLRTEVFDAVQGVLGTHDLLVSPTLCALAVPNGTDRNTVGPREVEGVEVDPLIGWCPTYLINYTGHPAVSLPAGLADGLPVGLQVVGRRHADADVLAAAAAFERARPWSAIYEVPAGRSVG